MPYLIRQDYLLKIQFSNLDAILASNDELRVQTERAAIARIKSRLVQKYDLTSEFRDTLPFSFTETYKAGQLVYLDAAAYSNTSTYALNALTLYQGNVYRCSTAITSPQAFTPNNWTLLGARYQYFNVKLPAERFDVYKDYSKTNTAFYKDKVYTCAIPSTQQTHQGQLQYGNTWQIPLTNYFPDTPTFGAQQWGSGTPYSVTGVWPTDTTKYAQGDNRNAELVEIAIYMTIYKLSPRISPMNVPDVWDKNFEYAEKWLKECASGKAVLDLPLLQPRQGNTMRMGSEVKRTNNY